MTARTRLSLATWVAALTASGCGTAPPVRPPDVPAALRPPADQTVFLEARATGVQIYDCAAKPGAAAAYEWTFRAPEATLADASGALIGHHYAGPTWQSDDGSSVVGEVKARDAGPDPSAIPWLLLAAKSTAGTGVLAATKSVQRVQTAGGTAPAETCDAAHAQQGVRVPYTASYFFYR